MYTFTKLHDRDIPNVGVGVRVRVGPVQFQLMACKPLLNAVSCRSFSVDHLSSEQRYPIVQLFASFESSTWQFFNKNISQGSVAPQLKCGDIFDNHFTTNLLTAIYQRKDFENRLGLLQVRSPFVSYDRLRDRPIQYSNDLHMSHVHIKITLFGIMFRPRLLELYFTQ